MKKTNKKLILGLLMVALLLVVGVTYAFFTYENGNRTEIVTGQIYLNYTEENKINLTNAWPETKETAMQRTDNVFNFTIEGQNTSKEDIYYAVKINYADDIAGKNRIKAEHIKIYLECDGDILIDGLTYSDWNDKKIEIATIPAGTTNMITKNYSLRMWIDENVTISDTSNSADYTTSEWNNTYANMIINVIGNFDYQDTDYITYDANGGDYTPVKTSVNTGKVTLQKPVMENKAFLGWSSDPDATEIEYYSGDAYTGDGQILYAVYGDTRNVMTDLSAIGESGIEISEVYFINETQENIDTRYDAATNKWDLTLDNQGSVKGWIETDTSGNNILYIGSEGTTYLSTGYELFSGWGFTKIDLLNVDTSMVTDMSYMFSYCYSVLELDLSMFNTSNVTNMASMFLTYGTELQIIDLSSFDTGKVTDMAYMFSYLTLVNLDLSNFNTSSVTNMSNMFELCTNLTSLDISNFDTSNVTNMSRMFGNCIELINVNLGDFDASKVTSLNYMFSGCINLKQLEVSDWNTESVESLDNMFQDCSSLISLDLSKLDTDNVRIMSRMFRGCTNLESLNMSGLNTSNLKSMNSMFQDCTSLTQLMVTGWDTKKVSDLGYMFQNCSSLVSLDLSDWEFNSPQYSSNVFNGCTNLKTIYANNSWNNGYVASSTNMFYNCTSLVGAVSFDSTKTDITMANPDTGYFTRKEA